MYWLVALLEMLGKRQERRDVDVIDFWGQELFKGRKTSLWESSLITQGYGYRGYLALA